MPPSSPPSRSPSLDSEPDLHFTQSATALLLVPDPSEQEDHELQLNFSPDEDEDDDDDDGSDEFASPSTSHTALSSTVVFLYLLAPLLRLGVLSIPLGSPIELSYSIPALFFFAGASMFTRQVWYLLARYTRKTSAESVLMDAFARASGKRIQRSLIRAIVRLVSTAFSALLVSIYFRASHDAVFSVLRPATSAPTEAIFTILAVLILLCLCVARNVASRRIILATTLSIATFMAWMICAAIEHTRSPTAAAVPWSGRGLLWEPLSLIAFAFTSSSTLSLYSSLSTSTPHVSTKRRRIQSFTILSVASTALAVAIILPVLVITRPLQSLVSSAESIQPVMACLKAVTLLLAIPSVIVAAPPIPIPSRLSRLTAFRLPISHTVLLLASLALGFFSTTHIIVILSDITLALSLLGAFVLPSLLHITIHYFKRPITIVVPTSGHSPIRTSGYLGREGEDEDEETTHMLLQRKEVALQRRRLWRRLSWDIGVWVLFLPIGGGGAAWAVGRLAGKW